MLYSILHQFYALDDKLHLPGKAKVLGDPAQAGELEPRVDVLLRRQHEASQGEYALHYRDLRRATLRGDKKCEMTAVVSTNSC